VRQGTEQTGEAGEARPEAVRHSLGVHGPEARPRGAISICLTGCTGTAAVGSASGSRGRRPEHSRLDQAPGKRLRAVGELSETNAPADLTPGRFWHAAGGVEQLHVTLRLERFENGAHVYLVCSQRSDSPDEITLTVHAEPDCAPMDCCILTATMGNMARARQLWLKEGMITSRMLYPDYQDIHFANHTSFPLRRLFTTPRGDVLVAITTDEADPAGGRPFRGTDSWYYGGAKATQFWRKPKGSFGDDLCAVVNARYTYWQSRRPIPGGIAFENFELGERFRDGQQSVFGITRQTPQELGFPTARPWTPQPASGSAGRARQRAAPASVARLAPRQHHRGRQSRERASPRPEAQAGIDHEPSCPTC